MKLNAGLIGLGRLGAVYARDLAARVTGVRLAALADTNAQLAEETARELDVPRWYSDPLAMLDDPGSTRPLSSARLIPTRIWPLPRWAAARPYSARSRRRFQSAKRRK